MATVKAANSGQWSAGGTWIGGSKPGVADTADSNGFAPYLDSAEQITSWTNSAVGTGSIEWRAGGVLTVTGNVTHTALMKLINHGSGNTAAPCELINNGTWTNQQGAQWDWYYTLSDRTTNPMVADARISGAGKFAGVVGINGKIKTLALNWSAAGTLWTGPDNISPNVSTIGYLEDCLIDGAAGSTFFNSLYTIIVGTVEAIRSACTNMINTVRFYGSGIYKNTQTVAAKGASASGYYYDTVSIRHYIGYSASNYIELGSYFFDSSSLYIEATGGATAPANGLSFFHDSTFEILTNTTALNYAALNLFWKSSKRFKAVWNGAGATTAVLFQTLNFLDIYDLLSSVTNGTLYIFRAAWGIGRIQYASRGTLRDINLSAAAVRMYYDLTGQEHYEPLCYRPNNYTGITINFSMHPRAVNRDTIYPVAEQVGWTWNTTTLGGTLDAGGSIVGYSTGWGPTRADGSAERFSCGFTDTTGLAAVAMTITGTVSAFATIEWQVSRDGGITWNGTWLTTAQFQAGVFTIGGITRTIKPGEDWQFKWRITNTAGVSKLIGDGTTTDPIIISGISVDSAVTQLENEEYFLRKLDAALTAIEGAGFVTGTHDLKSIHDDLASSGITQQQVADALKLAPTAGAPAAGSVNAHLDTLITDMGYEAITYSGDTTLENKTLSNKVVTIDACTLTCGNNLILDKINILSNRTVYMSGTSSTMRNSEIGGSPSVVITGANSRYDDMHIHANGVTGDVTISGDNLVFNGCEFRGDYANNHGVILSTNTAPSYLINCIIKGRLTINDGIWILINVQVTETIVEGGGTVTKINCEQWSKEATLDTIKNKAGTSGFDRTTDSLEALAELIPASGITAAQVTTACVNALNTALPDNPVANSAYDILKFLKRAILTVKEEILSRLSNIKDELISAIYRKR